MSFQTVIPKATRMTPARPRRKREPITCSVPVRHHNRTIEESTGLRERYSEATEIKRKLPKTKSVMYVFSIAERDSAIDAAPRYKKRSFRVRVKEIRAMAMVIAKKLVKMSSRSSRES